MPTELILEHNLTDLELETALEKALRGVRGETPRPFDSPFLMGLNDQGNRILGQVFNKMLNRISEVLK